MLIRFIHWAAPPVFPDDEDLTRRARLLHMTLLAFLAFAALYGLAVPWFESNHVGHLLLSVLLLSVMGGLWLLLHRGHVRLAGLGLIASLWLVITFILFISQGVHGSAFSGYIIPIICAAIFYDRRAALGAAGGSVVAGLAWLAARQAGWLPPPLLSQNDASAWITQSLYLAAGAILLSLANYSVEAAFKQVRQELTERRAEEALAREHDLLQALMDNIPDAIYFKDTASRFTRVNPALAHVLNSASVDQPIGRTDFDYLPADLAGAIYAEEQRVMATGTPLLDRLEFNPDADGRPRWLSATKVPLRGPGGDIIGLVGISRDVTERQLAEERLRQREDLYRRAITAADAVPYHLDYRTESYAFMSDAIFDLTGYTAEEVTPAMVDSVTLSVEMRGEHAGYPAAEAIRRVRAGLSRGWKSDLLVRARDGESRWVADSAVQILDDDGRAIGAIGILFDITGRKRAESALQQAELKYRTLVEQTPAVVYSCEPGPAGRWLYVSPNVERMLGFSRQEWLADETLWQRQLHDEDREQAAALHALSNMTGAPFLAEYRFHTRDGRVVWLRDEAAMIRDDAGRLISMRGLMLDITGRKQAEEALRDAEARYRELVERIPAVVYSSEPGPAGRWHYVSPQIERIFGYTPAEWLDDPDLWYASIHPDDRQTVIDTEAAALAAGLPPQMEYRLTTRAGAEVWVRDESTGVPTQAGGQTLVQGFLLDITARKQVELLAQRQLQELTALHAVATTIAAAETEDQLLERLTGVIGSTFYPDNFGILLVDRAANRLTVHPSYHGATQPGSGSIPIGQGVVGGVAASGLPRRVADVRTDPNYYPEVSVTLSELCVPVVAGEKILGVINTESERLGAFSDSDERLLMTIAGQLATALERLRAEAARRTTAARMEILHAIDTALLSSQSPADIAQSAADKVRQLVACQRVSVSLFDLPADKVRFLAVSASGGAYLPANSTISVEAFGAGIVQVLQQGLVKVVDDVRLAGPLPETDRLHALAGIRAWANVPLIYQGNLVGALNIGSIQPGAFTTDIVNIAREVADQLAIALQQARLNSEMAEALAREQRLNAVAQTISGVLDLPSLLADIVRLAGELVGAEFGSLSLAQSDQQEITDVYAFNVPPSVDGQTLSRGQGLTWQVFEEGQSILLNEYARHPRALPDWVAAGLQRYVGVPIIANEVRLGTLGLYKLGQSRPFSARDLAAAESVGRQAGVAIRNARLVAALERELREHARAEQALLESGQILRALLNASLDAEFLIDTQGRFLELNETFARSLNRSAADLVGADAFQLPPPGLAASRRALIDQAIRERRAIRFQDQFINAWYDNSIVPIYDEHGQVSKLAVFARDITEQKQAEADLRHRDAILEAVAFAAQQFLETIDWQSVIAGALRQLGQGAGASHAYIFENHSGPDGKDLTSQRFEWAAPGIPPHIDDPAFQNVSIWADGFLHWTETLSRGEPYYGSLSNFIAAEAEHLAPQGVKSLLEVPIIVDGVWWGIIGFDDFAAERDWSVVEVDALKVAASTLAAAIQRQRTDEQIRRLNADLERRVIERTAALEAANRELEAFSYSVSHDLRAPLRSIDGFSQALLEDYQDRLDADGRRYLSIVRDETQRMGRLIDDLLSLSRVTRRDLRRGLVDLSQLAGDLVAVLRQREPARQVEVTIAPGMRVNGDLSLLQIMLDNLINNAWKFTGKSANARIELGVQRRDGRPVYFVRDNGAGFDMAYSGKLFGVFQRLHAMTEFEGTGVGLATVARIIQRHGGRVWAEGVVGEGAVFYFTLPG